MSLNQIKIEKSLILDVIEIKSATFIDKTFPLHFHQSWSLASVEFGSENISFANSSFLLNKRAVILIPPFSVHKHWGNKNSAWGYKAIYLNNDVIKYVTKKINIDYSYIENIPYFITYVDNAFEINEKSIFKVLENILLEVVNDSAYLVPKKNKQTHFEDILSYLSQHYNESITLDSLEKKFKINKFNLQKNFKAKIGLSPTDYLTAVRIEKSKQLFDTASTLTDIAIESGFYDQSHYTHSFVKFVGVTPGVYKRSVKILQD
jgi:AraC-like DNA-binding protein